MSCARCGDAGYLVRPGQRWAEAFVCGHFRDCPGCGGRGARLRDDGAGAPRLEPCACGVAAVARRVERFDRARIPAYFAQARLDSYRWHDREGTQFRARSTFVELSEAFRPGQRGVGLSGKPGVGKTHLLAALCGYLAVERAVDVRYADFADLIGELRARFELGGGAEALVGTVVDAPVLFIDELGKGRATEWEQSIVDAIISRRYSRGLSLFFATNYALEAGPAALHGADEPLQARIGERTMSRLREMCQLMTLHGPDGRAGVAAEAPAAPAPPAPARGAAPRGLTRVR
jgi:DNA replication protein DnaC